MIIEPNNCYNIDCKLGMKLMQKQGLKADWCITDPPYGIGVDGQIGGAGACENIQYTQKDWDKERIDKKYFDLMFSLSDNQLIFGANYYTDILPPCKALSVWNKRVNDKDRNNFADCEFFYSSQGVSRVFNYQYKGMIQGDMKNKDERFHPTQKPTQLWYKLLDFYTKEGDLVLDPFAGSQSLRIACHKLKRNYIGFEIDKEYYEKGCEWFNKTTAQVSIFDLI